MEQALIILFCAAILLVIAGILFLVSAVVAGTIAAYRDWKKEQE